MALAEYEKEHIEKMRRLAPECMVLLKQNGDFPLAQPEKVALYGNGARKTIKGGTGSGDVNSRFFVTVETGLQKAGFFITTDKWLDAYDRVYEQAKAEFIKKVKAEARAAKVNALVYGMGKPMPETDYELPLDGEGELCVYVLARNSGEGNDRTPTPGDILLTETEIRDILACQKKYKKFCFVNLFFLK